MPLVAIAGGSSPGLGRSITQAVVSTYPSGEWKPVVLSRTSTLPSWAVNLPTSSLEIRKVDYTSQSSLESALEGCHTVISVILATDGTQSSSQIALLNAAIKVGCQRFVPSEWACGPAGIPKVNFMRTNPSVWAACENSSIEWARFNVGLFMNYFGIGCAATEKGDESAAQKKEDETCAGIDRHGDMADGSGSFLLSMASRTAEMPMKADGVSFPRITLTELGNMGEFVAASLSLKKWERDMNIVGCTIRRDELLQLANKIVGGAFEVKRLTRGELEEHLASLSETDVLKRLWLELKLMYSNDAIGEGILEPVVNGLCPNVKPLDVETYLRRSWES
jgi:hypothetical protein